MLTISSGLMINCTFTFTSQGGEIGNVYTCRASVYFVGDTRTVTEINEEDHLVDKTSNDVEAFYYEHPIGFTPRNVNSFFPNLKALHANSINSAELRREDVEGFKDLQYLRFSDNSLKELENDLFYNNHFLTSILLDSNPIRHVGHNVFNQLNRLTFLNMLSTTCISRSASEPADVERLVLDILIHCPPTLQMTEDKIVNGSPFTDRVEAQIKSELEVLISKQEVIENQLNHLEQRIEDLEQTVNSASSSPH